jgi:hypothetical protein
VTRAEAIAAQCDALKALLLVKDAAYGSSVSKPIHVFSKLPPIEGMCVRLDDTLRDLAGYVILVLVELCAPVEPTGGES